jgi:hypothetical protein
MFHVELWGLLRSQYQENRAIRLMDCSTWNLSSHFECRSGGLLGKGRGLTGQNKIPALGSFHVERTLLGPWLQIVAGKLTVIARDHLREVCSTWNTRADARSF